MIKPLFVTGIGTGVGKTLVCAILTEALQADYWKPVQAGIQNGTDSGWVRSVISNKNSVIHPERYRLTMAASPHIAARNENIIIEIEAIRKAYSDIRQQMPPERLLIIEGAGGLMVPLSDDKFVADLVAPIGAATIIVSRNYLGSINHSLLTAAVCARHHIDETGWIFNDQYLDYEEEIARWSGIPKISAIPYCYQPGRDFVAEQAEKLAPLVKQWLGDLLNRPR